MMETREYEYRRDRNMWNLWLHLRQVMLERIIVLQTDGKGFTVIPTKQETSATGY